MDVYSMVTERIINQLEKGEIPWKKPWAKCLDGTFNRITRKPYSLLNKLLLLHGGEYATFKQWEQIGGRVKNGEKSEIVVFWKLQDLVEKDENGDIEMKQIPLLRYYNVFHISQVNNVMPLIRTEDFGTKPIERAETILHEYLNREHITLSAEESDRAFYSLQTDSITVPKITQFEHAEEYYSTVFHECGHSTMTAERCNREKESKSAFFGSEKYSKEELIAEITSATIMNSIRLETPMTFQNSTVYIQNWLNTLKNDKKLIVSASGKAEKAARYILNIDDEKEMERNYYETGKIRQIKKNV